MSPELCCGEGNSESSTVHFWIPTSLSEFGGWLLAGYAQKNDIWALGCVVFEMMCLEKAFEDVGPLKPEVRIKYSV